jgi:3',5'-cyclic AMP phosphodiesterase CpdA
MYQKKLGNTHYAFTYKNWKFIILEAVHVTSDRKYSGYISADQISWIKKEIFNTNPKTPIAIITHIPFLTSSTQFKKGALTPNSKGLVVENSREILDLFTGYNLRLVLQGHLHILEDNYIGNIHFITGGAVCGSWWKGPHEGTGEGFLFLKFSGEDFSWKYVEYGWLPELQKQ